MTASMPRFEPRRMLETRPITMVLGLVAAAAAALVLLLAGYAFLKEPAANLLGPPAKSALVGLEKAARGATNFLGAPGAKPSPSGKKPR